MTDKRREKAYSSESMSNGYWTRDEDSQIFEPKLIHVSKTFCEDLKILSKIDGIPQHWKMPIDQSGNQILIQDSSKNHIIKKNTSISDNYIMSNQFLSY